MHLSAHHTVLHQIFISVIFDLPPCFSHPLHDPRIFSLSLILSARTRSIIPTRQYLLVTGETKVNFKRTLKLFK